MTQHLTPYQLDRLAQGSLTPTELVEAQTHLATCEHCRREQAQQTELLRIGATSAVARGIARLPSRPRVPWFGIVLTGAAVAAGLAGVMFLAQRTVLQDARHEPELALKGGPTFHLYVKRGETVQRVTQGMKIQAGDALRGEVTRAGMPCLLVVSLDERGAVAAYHPFGGAQSECRDARMATAPEPLDEGLTLDAAPGPERVFALFSAGPISVEAVRAAAKYLGAFDSGRLRQLDALPGIKSEQRSVLLER